MRRMGCRFVRFRAVTLRPVQCPAVRLAHAAAVQIATASIFGSFPAGGKTAGSH